MNEEKIKYIQTFIKKANLDLIAAERLFEIDTEQMLAIIGFHAQQCIEKYLKAYLVFKEIEFEFTHNLGTLRDKCSDVDSEFAILDFKNLIAYAVEFRYSDDEEDSPEEKEIEAYITIAKMTKNLVLNKIDLK